MTIKIWGIADEATIEQIERCADDERVAGAALMADNHKGYSQPIGGVVAYRNAVSPSGVGYDIGCGNKAVRTNLKYDDIKDDLASLASEIYKNISFGIGRKNNEFVDHWVLYHHLWNLTPKIESLKPKAEDQLGTVGSGNHYVDVFVEDATGDIWVGVHFGSRGLGHTIASGYLNLIQGRRWEDKAPGENMDSPPVVVGLDTALGEEYMLAMELAGMYAYAGRDVVVSKVLDILGAQSTFEVHNHHNYAWREVHNGEELIVVRKGATPCRPGEYGFVGGSMGDISVIYQGLNNQEARDSFYSTVHGAGRIMSRTKAAGKWKKVERNGKKVRVRQGGLVNEDEMRLSIKEMGIELRGAGADEAPQVYRKLQDVLDAHAGYMKVTNVLRPIIVCMAGSDEFDPYKD